MAYAEGRYVRVEVYAIARTYDYVEYRWKYYPSSSSVWNNDGQKVIVDYGGQTLFETTIWGQQVYKEGTVRVTRGKLGAGQAFTSYARIRTWDNAGDGDFWAQTQTGNESQTPTPLITASNFTISSGTATTRSYNFSGLRFWANEAMKYRATATTFKATSKGQTNGTIIFEGLTANTKENRSVGSVANNANDAYINSFNLSVFPLYSPAVINGFTAKRRAGTPTTLDISWVAVDNLGNMSGWKADIVINRNGTLVKTISNISLTGGNTTATSIPTGSGVTVEMKVYGSDHEAIARTVTKVINLDAGSRIYIKYQGRLGLFIPYMKYNNAIRPVSVYLKYQGQIIQLA